MTEKSNDLQTKPSKQNHNSKLRGMSELTIDAIHGVTHIVENLHGVIQSKFLISNNQDQKSKGLSGFVYKNIRYITDLVGSGVDSVLKKIEKIVLSDEKSNKISYSREAILSALNGVLGDHLLSRNNPLAIKMQLRHKGLNLNDADLYQLVNESNGKILLMIHGLCMNDLQWTKVDHNHGEHLAKSLGLSPIYLHYNTGLHVSENGKELESILEQLIQNHPSIKDIYVLAHSMGGLVTRSACAQALDNQNIWLSRVKKIVFLGTPHHGANLEKLGNWIDTILKLSQYTKPFSRLAKIRSCGITDLRFGNVLESDWQHEDRFESILDQRVSTPLIDTIEHYAVAATTSKENKTIYSGLLGDGLVTIDSSLGRHKDKKYDLAMEQNHCFLVSKTNHMQLLNSNEVYQQIYDWFEDNKSTS